ncbi:Cof-type HAD-IIB family hydrolase [Sphaerisporangium sp. NPDC005288]|uniref:Cof-type HAD-IIB family hydrolase n=1 Tax=Sphaerisporangium sp. NPDC005288 TaxID=3155114 RepID=UPI0033A6E244
MNAVIPRLVATDLDGTLVRSDGTISARTVEAVTSVLRSGAEVVFVTGRPPRKMADIRRTFGAGGLAICSNGALVYDLGTRNLVVERPIEPSVLVKAAGRLRAAVPDIGLAVEYAADLAGDEVYEPWDWDADVTLQRLPDADLLARPAPKLLGRHHLLSADQLLDLVAPHLGDLVTVYHSNGLRLVEAVAKGVSKASALARLAAERGISRAEVVAFGDMPNDLPMLEWAGRSYAVANAHPRVLGMVDHVIDGNDDDGVAKVLERLFPLTAGFIH